MADTIMINSFRSEQQQQDVQVDNQDSKIQMKTRSVIVPKHLTMKIESMSYVAQQMKKLGMKGQNILLSEIGSLDGLVQQNQLLSIMTQRMMEFEFRANQQERSIHVPIQQRVQQFAFNPLILQQQVSQIKCNICLGFVDNQLIVEPCKHIFCNECTQNYITNKIITGEVLKITCPEQDCQTEFDDDFIKSQICDSIYTKFLKFRRIKQHESIKNGRWCPKPECENFVYQDPRLKDLYCPCGQQFCFDCGNPSHPNKNCEEAIDQGFLHAVKQYSIHKCPKCKSFIQKNEGCNHMTCQHCYYEFCWLCSQRYSALHYDCWNPCCCPGDQHTQRAPYKYPRLLIGVRAIFKILLYVLLSPLAVAAGAGAIIYVVLVLLCKGICVVTEAIQDCC